MKAYPVLVFLVSAFSGAYASARFVVGAPSSMIARLGIENTAFSKTYTFQTPGAELIRVDVEDYSFEKGWLSMVGRAQESRNSDFILKGDNTGIYGWVVLKNRGLAFEYTTDANGMVVVEQVPVEKIFPICDFENQDEEAFAGMPSEVQRQGPEPHIGPYPAGLAVNKFQSKPGAPKVLYWDISGAPDVWTPEQMWEAWQTYSAIVSMFDVNVTTDPDVYNAAPVANRGGLKQNSASGTSSCGVSAFGTSRFCNIYKKSSPAYQGGTLGHEGGHLIGLSHDGTSSSEYASGLRPFQWVPLMGSHASGISYAQCALQYSKGEYTDANQKQDDFNIITVTRHHMGFRAKTHVGQKALQLTGTTVAPLNNRGQIVQNTDTDVWSFGVTGGAGRAKLKVARTERPYGSMLDIDASILDASGKSLAQSNKAVNREAEFDLPLPAGNYTLTVKGGAEGTLPNGFSNYSSLGFYAIEGEITGGVVSVAGRDLRNAITVSPIAWGGKLNLDIPLSAKVEAITLYAGNGKIAYAAGKRVSAIDMSGLTAGNYLLRIAVDGSSVTRSVTKR